MSILIEILVEIFGGAAFEGITESKSKRVRRSYEIFLVVAGIVAVGLCVYLAVTLGGGDGIVAGVCFAAIAILVLFVLYQNLLAAQSALERKSEDPS